MRLEIDSATIRPQDAGGVAPAGPYGAFSRTSGANGGTPDSAEVSGTSQLLNNLSSDRAARIQQLTVTVQDGTYNVPSTLIAQSIIGETAASGSYGTGAAG